MGNDFWFESTGVSQKNEGGVWFEKSEFYCFSKKERQKNLIQNR